MEFSAINNLEQRTTNSNLERGRTYQAKSTIINCRSVNNQYFSAIVKGGKKYRVIIELGMKDFRAWCSCPYDSRGLCKHQVALALQIRNNKPQISQQTKMQNKLAIVLIRAKIINVYLMHLWHTFF